VKFSALRWFVLVLVLGAASQPVSAALSPGDEWRLGKQVVAKVRPLGLTQSPALDAIGARLAKTMQRQDITWHFWVVEDMKEFNAFAAPGGFVFISRPYFEKLDTNEAAFVIGHEMAHIDLRHPENAMQRAQRANIGNLLLRVITNSPVVGAAADLGATAYVTHYSRVLEREADFASYRSAEKAGYNAAAAVTALSKLGKDHSLHPWIENVYGTHPLLSNREDQLSALGGKDLSAAPLPPPSPQHKLSAGLQPFDPPVPVAVRILAPTGKRWEGPWRKSYTKLIHNRLLPLGFKIAGDDLMYKPDIGDPVEAARSRQARYLLLVTVQHMSSRSDGQAKQSGQPVVAELDASARFLDVATGKEVWSAPLKGSVSGVDVLPIDPETLFPDTTVGAIAWRTAGDMAVGFAKHVGAKPEVPKPPDAKPPAEPKKG